MIASFPQNSSTPNSNPNISMGIGGQQPVGMGMFGGFPQIDQYSSMSGIMGGFQRPSPQPMMSSGYQQSPYQQPYPQPQQYGGYGMSQGYGGQSSFAPMSNPYQPQQYGNSNNFSGYGMQQGPFGAAR